MYVIIFVFIFLLGTIIGSFLNVVIFRWNTGKSIVKGKSMCMTCSRSLRWFELVPVFSFLIQSGRCRRCASRISHQYPLVELVTGFVFVLIADHFLPILFSSYFLFVILISLFAFVFSLLIVISVYDIKHKIIPDGLVYLFIGISFLSIFINPIILNNASYSGNISLFVLPSLITLLSGPILASPFAFLWFVSRGRWMGFGDAKLVLGIGWLLPLALGFSAVVLSFWIGTIISLLIILFSKTAKINMKTEVPFAPFLILATLITFLYNIDVMVLFSYFGFNI